MELKWYHIALGCIMVALGTAAFLLGRRSKRPDLDEALDVIELRADVKERILDRDAESARQWVENRYAETIKQLDEEARARAVRLRGDPVALAVFFDSTARKLAAEQGRPGAV